MSRDLMRMADAAARKNGVPTGLFRRLVQQESGWNPDARNPSGATGLVQIHLPSHPDISEQQARDPAFALAWGARYLAIQKKRFGRWDLALAAYNAGPGNVEKHGGVPPFAETQNYVKNIMRGGKVAASAPAVAAKPGSSQATQRGGAGADTLLADIFRSNNQLLGVETPDLVADLLATPRVAAPLPAPVPPPSAGAPGPQHARPSVAGFTPAFQGALDGFLAATGLTVNSGYRSPERQAQLFADAVRKYGSESAARKWVAPPGRSKHNHGVAADLGGDLSKINDGLLAKYGLWRPMPYEPWHVELRGSRG